MNSSQSLGSHRHPAPVPLERSLDALQYQFLRWWGRPDTDDGACTAVAYAGRSKLEALFGADFWPIIQGRTVLDFGCGTGSEAIELATHGAHRVVGLDIRPSALAASARAAAAAGVADRCVFTSQVEEPVDIVVSVDTFEHVADPAGALQTMHRLLGADGRVFLAFGPPWRHPYGGHLFSVFPWAHLLFSERALIRWRGDFKTDGATHFDEVEGGLNQMTVSRFARLIADSGFTVERYETVPIRQLRWLARIARGERVREYTTSIVRCILNPGRSRP